MCCMGDCEGSLRARARALDEYASTHIGDRHERWRVVEIEAGDQAPTDLADQQYLWISLAQGKGLFYRAYQPQRLRSARDGVSSDAEGADDINDNDDTKRLQRLVAIYTENSRSCITGLSAPSATCHYS